MFTSIFMFFFELAVLVQLARLFVMPISFISKPISAILIIPVWIVITRWYYAHRFFEYLSNTL